MKNTVVSLAYMFFTLGLSGCIAQKSGGSAGAGLMIVGGLIALLALKIGESDSRLFGNIDRKIAKFLLVVGGLLLLIG